MPLDFAGGGSSASPVTSQVDAWTGASGAGWLTPWASRKNGTITFSTEVRNDQPLTDGKNRLAITVNKTRPEDGGGDAAQLTLYRQYDTSLVEENHTVSFQFRLDSSITDISRISFYDAKQGNTSPTGGTISWYIISDDNQWKVYNGGSTVNSDIAIVQDHIYDFSISIVGDQYSVVIDDLSTSDGPFTSALLNFHQESTVGGFLNFHFRPNQPAVANTTITSQFSLGSVTVIPEPSQVALLGVAAVSLLVGQSVFKARQKYFQR